MTPETPLPPLLSEYATHTHTETYIGVMKKAGSVYQYTAVVRKLRPLYLTLSIPMQANWSESSLPVPFSSLPTPFTLCYINAESSSLTKMPAKLLRCYRWCPKNWSGVIWYDMIWDWAYWPGRIRQIWPSWHCGDNIRHVAIHLPKHLTDHCWVSLWKSFLLRK